MPNTGSHLTDGFIFERSSGHGPQHTLSATRRTHYSTTLTTWRVLDCYDSSPYYGLCLVCVLYIFCTMFVPDIHMVCPSFFQAFSYREGGQVYLVRGLVG